MMIANLSSHTKVLPFFCSLLSIVSAIKQHSPQSAVHSHIHTVLNIKANIFFPSVTQHFTFQLAMPCHVVWSTFKSDTLFGCIRSWKLEFSTVNTTFDT